MCILITQTKI